MLLIVIIKRFYFFFFLQVKPFSIQDPFILSRNISRNDKMKTSFKIAMQIAKELILKPNFSFPLLFNLSFYLKQMNEMFSYSKRGLPNAISFSLYLNPDLCCKLGLTSRIEPWYKTVCDTLFDVLQYGLLIDCEVCSVYASSYFL